MSFRYDYDFGGPIRVTCYSRLMCFSLTCTLIFIVDSDYEKKDNDYEEKQLQPSNLHFDFQEKQTCKNL